MLVDVTERRSSPDARLGRLPRWSGGADEVVRAPEQIYLRMILKTIPSKPIGTIRKRLVVALQYHHSASGLPSV